MLKFEDLQDGKDYISIDLDGRKYKGTFVNDYFGGGVGNNSPCVKVSSRSKIISQRKRTQRSIILKNNPI